MATSGSTNYKQTRTELIQDALQYIGEYGIGRTVSSEDMNFSANVLNKMIKSWSTEGLHLFTKEEAILFITPNVGKYELGDTAKAAKTSDVVTTRLDGSHAAAATSLTVDSTTGMAVSDTIGIVTTDKTIHWTTIATIPSSTTLTISSGLDTAASDEGLVYTYTSTISKPLRILDCRRRTGFDSGATSTIRDITLASVSYNTYFDNPAITSGGTPTQFHYNPKLTSGSFYLWQRPQDGSERIVFTYERIIEDLDSASDDFDFPSEWLEALTLQLAMRLCIPFGKLKKLSALTPIASAKFQQLLNWDSEITSIEVQPDLGYD